MNEADDLDLMTINLLYFDLSGWDVGLPAILRSEIFLLSDPSLH